MAEEGKQERGVAITCTIIALIILAIVVLLFVCSIVVIFLLALLGPSIGEILSRLTSGLEQPYFLFLGCPPSATAIVPGKAKKDAGTGLSTYPEATTVRRAYTPYK